MKKLTLLLITLCMLITTTYAYNVIKTVNGNQLITSANSGEVITVKYMDVAGYTFNGWSVTGATIANLASKEITFTMPNNDVTIEPNMMSSEKYTLTWTINNITHSVQKTPGESITITADEVDGYNFTGWTATGITVANTASITFTMPNNDVTIVANFEESAHVHEYSQATCVTPPTCSCGATNGNALGHSWVNATCTVAKTCSVCSATEGNALGHSWNNATCTTAKTCSVCSVTEGSALGHEFTGTRTCNQNGTNDTVKCVRYGIGGCTATENQTCTHTYTITVTQANGGTISPTSATVKAGGSATFTITPSSGWSVNDVKVNGISVGAKTSYTISDVTSN